MIKIMEIPSLKVKVGKMQRVFVYFYILIRIILLYRERITKIADY